MVDERLSGAKAKKESEASAKEKAQAAEAAKKAEYAYIGDDGGRWLFQRRSDGLAITIDKPKNVILDVDTKPMPLLMTVRGKVFNDEIRTMVKK